MSPFFGPLVEDWQRPHVVLQAPPPPPPPPPVFRESPIRALFVLLTLRDRIRRDFRERYGFA